MPFDTDIKHLGALDLVGWGGVGSIPRQREQCYKSAEVRTCLVCLKSIKEAMWPIEGEGGDPECLGWEGAGG